VQLIHLFYEVLYGVAQIDQTDGGGFVLSQGDPTSYGFYGDFMNGWDMDVLTLALTQYSNNNTANSQISQCPPLAAVDDSSEFSYNCPEYPPVVNETVHGIIGAALPGCIEIVNGPGASTPADANKCSISYNPPALNVYPAQSPVKRASFTAGQVAGAAGCQYTDCYIDNLNQTRTSPQRPTPAIRRLPSHVNCGALKATTDMRMWNLEGLAPLPVSVDALIHDGVISTHPKITYYFLGMIL